MRIKNMIKNASKSCYFITFIIVVITYITQGFIIYGFMTLLGGSTLGVVAELIKDKRILLVTLHSIGALLSAFTIWFFACTDPMVTMIFF